MPKTDTTTDSKTKETTRKPRKKVDPNSPTQLQATWAKAQKEIGILTARLARLEEETKETTTKLEAAKKERKNAAHAIKAITDSIEDDD